MLTKGKALKLTKKDKALRLRKPIMCYPPSLSICTGVKDFSGDMDQSEKSISFSVSFSQVQGYNDSSDLCSLVQQIANNIPILWERHSKASVSAGYCALKLQTCKQIIDSCWLRQHKSCHQQEIQEMPPTSASSKEVLLLYTLNIT